MPTYEHGNGWTDTLPKTLQIGSYTYALEVMGPGHERQSRAYGECNNNDQVIHLGAMMKEQNARDTLLHEVLHAMIWAYGIAAKDKWQEHLCTVLPMAMMLFSRDNPEVFAWIFPHTSS